MTPLRGGIRFEDRLRAGGELYAGLLHRREGSLLAGALAVAAAIHVAAAFLPFPKGAGRANGLPARAAVVRPVAAQAIVPVPFEFEAPPPRKEETPPVAVAAPERVAPPPRREADLVEPVAEAEPEMAPDGLPPDVEILLGVPEPPPTGPAPAEAGIVTNPQLIPESRVQPVYPRRARQLGAAGNVVLDVAVLADGTVGEVAVLRCAPADLGFCQAAVRAVKRWRYRPGARDGRPAQFFVTVKMDFVP